MPKIFRGHLKLVLLGTLTAIHAGQPATLRAQTSSGAEPAGPEFHVNTYTTATQQKADVAMNPNGSFVVTWHSDGQDGAFTGIFAQRYDRAGAALGAEFRVNSYTTSAQAIPHVGNDAKGNFVVAWSSYRQDGSGYGIFAQRFDAAGNAVGAEFQVNTYTTGHQGGATANVLSTHNVSMNARGEFVIVWQGYGPGATTDYAVLARRYDRTGSPIGAEFRVNEDPPVTSLFPAAKLAGNGSFVVVWGAPDGNSYGIFARRFDTAAARWAASSRSASSRPASSSSAPSTSRARTAASWWPGTATPRTAPPMP